MGYQVMTAAVAALALAGSMPAQAQVYVDAPPAYVVPQYAPPPVVVAPVPRYVAPPAAYVAPGYAYGSYGYGGYAYDDYAAAPRVYVAPPVVSEGYVAVDSYTGRRCTMRPDGFRWCWTP
jgi:hypothetical protein